MIRALLLTGQSSKYHDWAVSSATLARRLRAAGLFEVTVVDTSSAARADGAATMALVPAQFATTDVVVIDYEGSRWPPAVESAIVDFVREGGGLVLFHATDNAFPDWPEFQEMCGLCGWGGRDESSGPKVRWRDGRMVLDDSPGVAMHPPIQAFLVTTCAADHPITHGLPDHWLHAQDELYSQLRGPAKNLEVLATAWVDSAIHPKATGEHEPVLMTIRYGRGRVFHTTLGHIGPADGSRTTAMDCVGFITTFLRGTEWAATGTVTQPVPADFPTAERTSIRSDR
jgi:type 1 glutamine amidotransferase